MKCSDVSEILGSYCKHELGGAVEREVGEHIASCSECMKEYRLMSRVMGALGELERIEPSADFTLRLWEKIDEWEARRRMFWLGALAGFIRRNRRVLATAAAVFVITLVTSVIVIQRSGPGSDQGLGDRMASPAGVMNETGFPGEAAEVLGGGSYAMRDVPQPVEGASDSAYTHYATGDRPAYPGEGMEDYVTRPVVKTVSGSGKTF